jgi:hypothetical protein
LCLWLQKTQFRLTRLAKLIVSVCEWVSARAAVGARILDGRWGIESLAMAIPKPVPDLASGKLQASKATQELAVDFLRRFGADLHSSRELAAIIKRSGLRGMVINE